MAVGLNFETLAAVFLLVGVALAVVAFVWLVIAAFRGARAQGSLWLFLLAGLVFAFPFVIDLAGAQMGLDRVGTFLGGKVLIQLRTADGRVGPVQPIKALAVVNILAAVLAGIGLVRLIVLGFREWSLVKKPVYLFVAAAVFIALPFAANHIAQSFIDLGPRERLVDGDMHLTLTGWDQSDYSVLRARPQAVVLQMANESVTDDTLRYLADMDGLRDLDLTDTKVTDKGLPALAALPALEALRLARTKITDAGFREYLLPKESLKMLDLSGTEVTPATVAEWRQTKPGRRALR